MKNKNVLLTGATGGIGSAIAKLLMLLGYTIYAPIRNLEKAKLIFGENPNIHFSLVSIESHVDTKSYISGLYKQGIVFDLVILAAGDFVWDAKFPGQTDDEKKQNAIDRLMVVNYVTSETVIEALLEECTNLSEVTLVIISSQAANFEESHPKRVGEEGYVVSKAKLSALGKRLKESKKFFEVLIEEPALVGTQKAKDEFTTDTIGATPDWEKEEKKPEEYAEELIREKLSLK
ncbi:MAG: short chain dehydrogenase [Candidatus Parcubacteria bacterium]|jgi:NADP-dependent 3-hydroxy acid dehydrogenase YdfG